MAYAKQDPFARGFTVVELIATHLTYTVFFIRLAPSNVHHRDGKRHVNTVPVKLLKPQTVARKAHVDHDFAKAVWRVQIC